MKQMIINMLAKIGNALFSQKPKMINISITERGFIRLDRTPPKEIVAILMVNNLSNEAIQEVQKALIANQSVLIELPPNTSEAKFKEAKIKLLAAFDEARQANPALTAKLHLTTKHRL